MFFFRVCIDTLVWFLAKRRRMMHAFLGRVESQMRDSALWRRETQAQWEETRESLERIVMHKVRLGLRPRRVSVLDCVYKV